MRPFRKTETALRALNRFGLGARPGEQAGIGDARSWLEAQLDNRPDSVPVAPSRVDIGATLGRLRALQRNRDTAALQAARQEVRRLGIDEARAALTRRVASNHPFVERLTAFWSNHLCVSVAAKPLLVGPLAGLYEREAIRPHVLGRFDDMVLASARHPAMLLYLDNAQSIGPNSQAAQLAGRRNRPGGRTPGLNENYARELMELHTVGVDGGYDQDDVEALARILTGWGVAGVGVERRLMDADADSPEYRFFPALHEPGMQTVMGVRYPEAGPAQGEAAIRDLCRHPSTARFLATKLVRHFVADDPPPDAVRTVARVFEETEGDLAKVSRSLIHLDGAWDPEHRKFRTPQEWLVAVLRAVGAREAPPAVVQLLAELRHPLWAPAAPKGYGNTRREWADPDALMNRSELARALADRFARNIEPESLLDVMESQAGTPLPALLGDRTIDRPERIALALGGPDFQWR